MAGVLTALGISGSTGLGGELARAIAELESTVDCTPFRAEEEPETWTVTGQSGRYALPRATAEIMAVESGGSPVEWSSCPPDARPIRTIVAQADGPLEVTGRAGFAAEIPADIWFAVRDLAAAFRALTQTVDPEVESVKEDSVTIRYRGSESARRIAEALAEQARLTFLRYRLHGVES